MVVGGGRGWAGGCVNVDGCFSVLRVSVCVTGNYGFIIIYLNNIE